MSGMIFSVTIILIAVLGSGSFYFLNRNQQKKLRERSFSVIRGQAKTEAKKSDSDLRDKRRAEIARKLQQDGADLKVKKKDGLKEKLVQAGMTISPKKYVLYSILFGLAVTGLMLLSERGPVLIFLVSFTAFFGAPRFFLNRKIKKRQKKFLENFADALEAMVRLLKAGMPVGEAIAMASREFEGPIGEEMARIYDAQKIGVSLSEATLEAARRMPLTEMQMFATGISIQSQTGSSLSEVLMNLARVIRARYRLKRKIQALSSEAKASAMIIGALPFLVGGGMYLINKKYMMMLIDTPTGQAWLIGSGVWMLIGCFMMRAMINFKI